MSQNNTTKTHDANKTRLKQKFESQNRDQQSITYRPVEKILVEGENFDELLEDGKQTFYLRCLNNACQGKGFNKQ